MKTVDRSLPAAESGTAAAAWRGPPALSHCRGCGAPSPVTGMGFCAACLMGPVKPGKCSAADRLPPGTLVGGHRLESCIGEGGFAEVYSAISPEGGTVAVKVLKRGLDSPQFAARFRAEQRTLTRLNHPGIVRIMDTGRSADGRSYFVMEQVDGLPVTEFCEVERLPPRARAALFAGVCDAVHHAHQKGVIHRDLKPSNILVEDGGKPKVIDFGIAKALEEEDGGGAGNTLVTRLGQVLGTPAYMSPEQAAGGDDADIRSDVYALGAVFFEMLTGEPPHDPREFRTRPSAGWAAFLRETDPGPASARLEKNGDPLMSARELRGDADVILAKALAGNAERRYASVEAFADDVRRWLAGAPVLARPPTLAYHVRRLVTRHKAAAFAFLSAAAVVVMTAVAGFVLARQSRVAEEAMAGERDRALRAEGDAQDARRRAEHEGYQAAIHLARAYLANGEPYLAADRLLATKPGLRGWEWGHLMAGTPAPEVSVDSGLPDASILTASPDGRFAAVADRAESRLLDLRTGTVICRIREPGPVALLAVSPDGALLASSVKAPKDREGTLRVHHRTGAPAWEVPFFGSGADIAWELPVGAALLTVNGNAREPGPGRLARLDRATGRVLVERTILRHKVAHWGIVPGPNGALAAVATSYAGFDLVTLPGLETVASVTGEGNQLIADVFWEEGGSRALFAAGESVYETAPGENGGHRLGGMASGDGGREEPAEGRNIRHLNRLPDGRWMAASDTAELIEGGTGRHRPIAKELARVPIARARRVVLLPGGRVEIRPEILPSPPPVPPLLTGTDQAEGRLVAVSPDSRTAVSQSWERQTLEVTDLVTGRSVLHPLPERARAAEWSLLPVWHPDGSLILGGKTGPFSVRIRGSDLDLQPLPPLDGASAAASSPDGSVVAFATGKGVTFLDWKTKAVLRGTALPRGSLHVFADPDGAAFYSLDATGVLDRLGPAPLSARLPSSAALSERRAAADVAFYPAGRILAVGVEASVEFYRLSPSAAPVFLHRLRTDRRVTALAFDPDGRRLAAATAARALTVWDWRESLPLLELPVRAFTAGIAYSADGRWLLNTDCDPALLLRGSGPWKE